MYFHFTCPLTSIINGPWMSCELVALAFLKQIERDIILILMIFDKTKIFNKQLMPLAGISKLGQGVFYEHFTPFQSVCTQHLHVHH